jgi:hypothetical protein
MFSNLAYKVNNQTVSQSSNTKHPQPNSAPTTLPHTHIHLPSPESIPIYIFTTSPFPSYSALSSFNFNVNPRRYMSFEILASAKFTALDK